MLNQMRLRVSDYQRSKRLFAAALAPLGYHLATALTAVSVLCVPARAQLLADAASVVGDSISRGFDADTSTCTYGDQPDRSYATGDDHGANFCAAGGDHILSHAERLECAKGGNIARFNDAETGAKINAFQDQATMIRTRFASLPGPHYVPVLLGHNDACSNVTDKTGNSCGGDRDPDNYCRTTTAAFEREFRLGLDELIQIPSTRIAVLALVRISQLCNFKGKNGCGALFGLECQVLWGTTSGILDDVFGTGGICASLTSNCSEQRQIDMYQTVVSYNEILERVTGEYAALPTGEASANGAVKAADVALRYVDAPFFYRFQSDDISCCDCFHPSELGQSRLAQYTWDGLSCTPETPCCAPSDDAFLSAHCGVVDTSSVHPGGFWANGVVCGNGIVDPGETCDDGNASSGDGCSDTCAVEGGVTPTGTPTGSPMGTGIATPTPTGSPLATGVATASPSLTPGTTSTPATPGACAGDCGRDGTVTVDELVIAVNIALSLQDVAMCPAADIDGDGAVAINELVAAVNNLLSGCRAAGSSAVGSP